MSNSNLPACQIQGIDITEVSIQQPKNALPANPNLNFDIHLEHGALMEKELFIVGTTITTFSGNKEQMLARFKADCVFKVSDMRQFSKDGGEGLDLPPALIEKMNTLSISTIRGLMFSAFSGTYLQKVVLPIIEG